MRAIARKVLNAALVVNGGGNVQNKQVQLWGLLLRYDHGAEKLDFL